MGRELCALFEDNTLSLPIKYYSHYIISKPRHTYHIHCLSILVIDKQHLFNVKLLGEQHVIQYI